MGSVNPTYLSTIVMRKKGKPQFHAYLQMLIFLSEEMDSLFNSFKTYFWHSMKKKQQKLSVLKSCIL